MDLFTLQALMQHRSLETTRSDVNMANSQNAVVATLKVPDLKAVRSSAVV
jgi:tRNA threonylcarbamoyladenosine modification (KEOPS) complex  Pcc1 subunit